ncbi:MAG: flagellar basal body L-ring protein FlgH [Chitinispirillia bacterium]|nr:flagellar basal body L-ring protein FlgH [Chitinispirillia bacterium]MCL2242165.1 flagellar basal body L-ring protein FlgH [Chitinispirillia bacterium]
MNRYLRNVSTMVAAAALCTSVFAVQMHSLFSDHRAMRVDDILTIIIVESAKAGSESKTNTSKGTDVGFKAGSLNLLSPQEFGAGNSAKFDGKGATSRTGSLSATVTARVIEVLESGNLLIEGSKTVEINKEKEIIKISGIVRPQDIQKNNVVYSTSIADAEITYTGNGAVNEAARPGFVTRFFNWLF